MRYKTDIAKKIAEIPSELKKKMILAASVSAVMAVMYACMYCTDTSVSKEDMMRPGVNDCEKVIGVRVSGSDGDNFDADIAIAPLTYTEDDIEAAFDGAMKVIDESMLGENESAENVTKKLNITDTVSGYPFSVMWMCDDYEFIDYDGNIGNLDFEADESRDVTLSCVLKYEGWIREKDYHITVRAPDMSDSSVRVKKIQSEINAAASGNTGEEYVSLPENVGGENLIYKKHAEWKNVFVILLLGAAAVAALCIGEKKKREDAAKNRTKELKRDYSEMIHKLALLMGAGMTVRMAWEHIVGDYKKRLEQKKTAKKYVYEEMMQTQYQLSSGMSEINAYREFGTRCDTKEYLKFSSLIVQNLKKGSRELVNLLELEAIDAFEERKNIAKKYGEEAGTKMLFPMVMMLVVVMGIIMLPAIMTFSM